VTSAFFFRTKRAIKGLPIKDLSAPCSACVRLYAVAEEVQIVGMPARDTNVTTIEELLALPEDGLRHELLDGEHVVTPAPMPRHQMVLQRLHLIMGTALDARTDIQLFLSPADVVLGPRSLVQPDLFIVSKDPEVTIGSWSDVGIPLLAVEVLSPSTASRDRGKKRRIYQAAGVGEYWIVDADARIVERWEPEEDRPEIVDATVTWTAAAGYGVTVDVPDLFLRALGPPSDP
jgi:Uma2 family endonuclease